MYSVVWYLLDSEIAQTKVNCEGYLQLVSTQGLD
jgi:hypothetical protein